MIRSELLRRLGEETGLKNMNDEAQKSQLVDLLNDAAEEIWTQTDLPRSLMEMTVNTSEGETCPTQRVTLPGFVGELRGIRDSLSKVTLHDIRPRYNNVPWPKSDCYTFRILREVPIARSIDNSVGLYMAPLDADPSSIAIDIVGSINGVSEYHASFAGDGTGSAVGVLWTDIFNITKDAITPTDVVLQSGDASGLEMARIPAYGDTSRYIEVDLLETPFNACQVTPQLPCRCLEVLYKPNFRPLLDDNSSFQLDGYDRIIILTAVKIYRIRGLGATATDEQIAAAKVHAVRADELLRRKIQDKIQPEELVIQFGPARGDTSRLRGLRRWRYGTRNTGYSYGGGTY
jgi:hypothetical protein